MLGASKRGMQVKLDASQTEWHRLVGSSSTSFCLYNEKWCALAPTASRMLLTIRVNYSCNADTLVSDQLHVVVPFIVMETETVS